MPAPADKISHIRREAVALRHLIQRHPTELSDAPFVHLAPLVARITADVEECGGTYDLADVGLLLKRMESERSSKRLLAMLKEAQVLSSLSEKVDHRDGETAVRELTNTFSKAVQDRSAEDLGKLALELKAAIEAGESARIAEVRESIATAALPPRRHEAVGLVTKEIAGQLHDALTKSVAPCSDTEGIRLRPGRGMWARWINATLGRRGALEPGRNLLAGAAPGAGKTSLAAAFTDDAIHAGCAVHWISLELGFIDTLDHVVAQYLPEGQKANELSQMRQADRIPTAAAIEQRYGALLTYDQTPLLRRREIRHVLDEVATFASRVQTLRRRGHHRHACQGLLIIDYVQRLVDPDLGGQRASYEAVAGACSIIQEAAANAGVVVMFLSQVTKTSQRETMAGDAAAFKGIDTNFADTALAIHRAAVDGARWIPAVDRTEVAAYPGYGEARLVSMLKTRGQAPHVYQDTAAALPTQALCFFQERMLWGEFSWAQAEAIIPSLGDPPQRTVRDTKALARAAEGAPSSTESHALQPIPGSRY